MKPAVERSVYDLFSFDVRYIPDFSYEKVCEQVGRDGKFNSRYAKKLNHLECGLFDHIEATVYDHLGNKSISLTSNDVHNISLTALQQLVDDCYEFYGEDNAHVPRGKFDDTDRAAIMRGQWPGRMWTNEQNNPGAMLVLDAEKLEMVISIRVSR